MSVYTPVNKSELEHFLDQYDLGKLCRYEPIAAGITNTNYTLDTEQGEFVLTLYEHHNSIELDYMLGLQQHLADKSVRCSEPVPDQQGNLYSLLLKRPAAIIHRLPGAVEKRPPEYHCSLLGSELARFHQAGIDYQGQRANPRGLKWILGVQEKLEPWLDTADLASISETLEEYILYLLP